MGAPDDEPRCGRLDDPDGILNHQEKRAALLLVDEGSTVVARPRTSPPGAPNPDLLVDAVVTEVKTPDPGADNLTIRNLMRKGKRQARHLLIDAREAQLSEPEARRGLARGLGAYRERYDRVRIVGDDYDVTWEANG